MSKFEEGVVYPITVNGNTASGKYPADCVKCVKRTAKFVTFVNMGGLANGFHEEERVKIRGLNDGEWALIFGGAIHNSVHSRNALRRV